MNAFEIYLMMQCDSIREAFSFAMIVCCVLWLCLFMTAYVNDLKRPSKKWLALPFAIFLLISFIPSSKTVAMIIGLPAITQSDNFKALPEDIAVFLRKIMAEYGEKK